MRRTSGALRGSARCWGTLALCAASSAIAVRAEAQTKPAAPVAAAGASSQGAAASGAATSGAAARGVEVSGTVLSLDAGDLVIDLGASAGVTENQVIEIWRPYKLKHPVSGKILTDRFKIGQIQIGQVRPTMAMAKAVGTLSRDAAPGDVVIFTRAAPSPAGATGAPATGAPDAVSSTTAPAASAGGAAGEAGASGMPGDPDAGAVSALFEGLRGMSVGTRIAQYEQFVREHPKTRFAQVLLEEEAALRQLFKNARAEESAKAAEPDGRPVLVHGPGKVRALSGRPVQVAVEIGGVVRGAVLHVRKKGETAFAPMPMKSAGRGYFAIVVPQERVADRDLEYFVEAVGEGGNRSVVGDAFDPERIEVTPAPPVRLPPAGKSSASVLTDFADYNRVRGNDYAWQTEGTFGIRFKDLGIRAVRMGFGVFRGVSGSVNELDLQGKDPRQVGLTYGYLEGEFGFHKYFSIIARGAVGLLDDGVSGGGQLFARIGNDQRTNLLLGGEVLGGVGLR
ncbi:MAG: hypothetical protein R3B70_23225, partial [Polyangiaceae bacterium]